MTQAATTEASLREAGAAQESYESQSYLQLSWRRLRRQRGPMLALAALIAICVMTIASPWLDESLLHIDPNRGLISERFQAPSAQHFLGTDDFGRDQLARLLVAGRVSLAIGLMVAGISLTFGIAMGLIAGYYPGLIDDGVNAIIQVVLNIPLLFILILLSTLFHPGVVGLSIIFGITGWPGIARQVRGRVLSERQRDYVLAALVAGATDLRIMYRHILPNVFSVVLVIAGFGVGGAILGEAGLSYLGLGVQVPTASWGNMLSNALNYFESAWWMVVAPGAAIVVTVFCIFYFADALRDALDPHLQD
ncbi:MAG TPA: ABC transporter permease [Dehalococcoidia bacterium]|nr:ABC transporter permease [Dehalococcoidia bacterium]